jgi:hypothetical protein
MAETGKPDELKEESGETKKLSEAEKLRNKYSVKKYNMIYDAFGKTLEATYFWLLDFLRHQLGWKVEKTEESMSATVVSHFFGEMGTRRTALERRAGELLGTINTVVKSIINLLYDLKEFDERLAIYDDLKAKKEGAEQELKRVWMDEVDVKKGTGALHALTTNEKYQFVTLRDAFYATNKIEDINKMDLNERVKNILKSRFVEYEKWLERSEKELRQRRRIELTYLKSQVNSLKLYTEWAKPYLKYIKQLGFRDLEPTNPDIVSAFNQTQIEVGFRGYKEVSLYEALKDRKYSDADLKHKGPSMYGIIDVRFNFRSAPVTIEKGAQGTGYGMSGKVSVDFTAYAMTKEQFKKLRRAEEEEDLKLIDELTNGSLAALKEDLDKYINELEGKAEKEKAKKPKTFIGDIFLAFKTNYGGGEKKKKEKSESHAGATKAPFVGRFQKDLLFDAASFRARDSMFTLYNVYKKAYGMLNLITFPKHDMKITQNFL